MQARLRPEALSLPPQASSDAALLQLDALHFARFTSSHGGLLGGQLRGLHAPPLKTSKSGLTLPPGSAEQLAALRCQEGARFDQPDQSYVYVLRDGSHSAVAPIGKKSSGGKARDHSPRATGHLSLAACPLARSPCAHSPLPTPDFMCSHFLLPTSYLLLPTCYFLPAACHLILPTSHLPPATCKARDHFLLRNDRPPVVTLLALVRDAAARLPGGEGSRADVCELLKESQFVIDGVNDAQISQVPR